MEKFMLTSLPTTRAAVKRHKLEDWVNNNHTPANLSMTARDTNVTLALPEGSRAARNNPFNNFDHERNSISSAVLNSEPLPNIATTNGGGSQNQMPINGHKNHLRMLKLAHDSTVNTMNSA